MNHRALALLLVGCGARTALESETPAAEPPSRDGAVVAARPCVQLAETLCARLGRCAPTALSNGLTGGRAVGADRCVTRVTLACDGWNSLPDLTATGPRVELCRQEVLSASCPEVGWRYFTDRPPCDSWPRGVRALGVACQLGLQCASGRCAFGADRACGRCAPAGAVATQRPGEACDNRVRHCQDWQRCAAGICTDRLGDGAECTDDGECDPSQGLACDRVGRRCVRRPVAPPGGACLSQIVSDPREPASAMCGVEQGCVNRNDFGQGQCRPLGADGAACESYDSNCTYPARCQGGRCVLPTRVVCAP